MRTRSFGRLGWQVSEVGYGMWGLAGWSQRDDEETQRALQEAVDLGCTFFDTALAYGDGISEQMLGSLVRANPGRGLIVASKIPPKNRQWPSRRGTPIAEVFPADYIRQSVEASLTHLGMSSMDLIQFHVWEEAWATDPNWQKTIEQLKQEGLIRGVGLSLNRWEPENGIQTLRTGLIDAVQVIYNIFDQAPEDNLFPICDELQVAVIARVPFDEGSLTGTLTKNSCWPEGDWRNSYFVKENLEATVDRVEQLRPELPESMSMPEMALRFILSHRTVSTVIPGMRKRNHVQANLAASEHGPLSEELLGRLRLHRWDRQPTSWSQ
ncbi:aldo/keto reductase [Tuwongella immobilis]|uniref:NADP-dependent oxidoreductase domain-containing protein n=1 Tax=Tuwongella immobilis TaxID=692036 RepID=A0A6C2YMT7_9BACT|nr:aldo/keto reductase [Tuwongella immobilis]VIP02687.1 Aldo/keto reductase OS=Verrucosispora maris (strain AB-18-032) GN=VAB18032_14210 PE=4 SV=1: Aldo_ket_red [Tuwongella immobilis]VTS02150.1 Aldo/keto reductase OS=Verrucosispora maris (strain AB-18-032) GN=VAB18032_14210 PE=4 SV=1: Aldo_ket_red [Tuwongella immobilis]